MFKVLDVGSVPVCVDSQESEYQDTHVHYC